MANIMLIANLNCDRVLQLEEPLEAGGRHHYQDKGRRLGGGGANTGLGLVWAGHNVALVSQIGRDETADWLLAEASLQGLNCSLLQRNDIVTPELMLLMTPDGERTIIRPARPDFVLDQSPDFSNWDALYINSSAEGVAMWSEEALDHAMIVAQLPKTDIKRPCHILITSTSDFSGRTTLTPWQYAQSLAGEQLEFFIITNGEHGATAYFDGGECFVSACSANVVDTTGAGDAFASGVINGLLQKVSIEEAMAQGAKWASFAVQTESSIPGEALRQHLLDK
ncbi:PfkB family carbohydrate kinase [Photobacterium minamisatsumaniensis]|uniref:PfkB family carbohydrate kinase n=1 Tax=Photobacterium minamisatsumaniensis TaxID=2910233 RepID=UPI003D101888